MNRKSEGIPDAVLTASWRPGDGPRHGYRSMICLDCGEEFAQEWERSYGQCMATNNEECPECGSDNIEPGGTAEPEEPDWDLVGEAREEARRERAKCKSERNEED